MKDAKSIDSLVVFKDQEQAGILRRDRWGCTLSFDAQYAKKNAGTMLTYHIPVQAEDLEFKGGGIPPYFAGLLPEGLRMEAMVRKLKTSKDDLFSFLVESSSDPTGDIHFGKDPETETEKLPRDFKKLSEEILSPREASGLAGVQLKISGERLTLPLGVRKRNRSTILKLGSAKHPNLVENEFSTLSLAKKCGLEVNSAKIIYDENQVMALLVERFDKIRDPKTKVWTRFHQEDACQFLDYYPADKYNLSLQQIADGIVKYCAAPEIEILKLLQLVAFSYLIGNGDLHAKNISLLQKKSERSSRLAPGYDLLCTALYGDPQMALAMDGKKENLKRKTFVEFGNRYGVAVAATETMLKNLVGKFEKHHALFFNFAAAQEKRTYLEALFAKRLEHLSIGS